MASHRPSFDYHSALRFEQEFDVWLRVVEITRTTIRYPCLLVDGGTRIATGNLTIACVSKAANGPMKAIDIRPISPRGFR